MYSYCSVLHIYLQYDYNQPLFYILLLLRNKAQMEKYIVSQTQVGRL